MRARRQWFVAGVAALVAAVVGAAIALSSEGEHVLVGGPLAMGSNATASGAPLPLATPFSWGVTILENSGDGPVTVEAVDLVEPPEAVRVLGMYALPIPNTSGIGLVEGFEPAGRSPTRLSIAAGESYQLIVGFELRKPGRHLARGVRVRYRAEDGRYETVLKNALLVCAPLSMVAGCETTAAEVFGGG